MRRDAIAMAITLIVIAPLALSNLGVSQAQGPPKGDVAAGKELYAKFCQKCHAPDGAGVPKMYKLVKATVVHLGSKEAQEKSDDFIRKSMTDGCCKPGNKMEPVKEPRTLTPAEIENVLAFVRTLKQ
ncbi:MAG TPA: cytochrome c [Blastocatellia bacterium]|nr:cytochrome c [Blastocatellia bacterium]